MNGLQLGPAPGMTGTIGGIMGMKPVGQMLREEAAAADQLQNQPIITGLVGHLRKNWSMARTAKQKVELEILTAMRSKRGDYDPDILAKLREQGSSEIFMMLFATKARQFKALLGDILLGQGPEKPWSVRPTPVPDMPDDLVASILQSAAEAVAQAEMSGMPFTMDEIRQMLRDAKDGAVAAINEEATARAGRAERKLEDILVEGGFTEALADFLDDLTVMHTAFIKGPVIERTGQLKWVQGPNGRMVPQATLVNKRHWKRVSALDIYPAPWSKGIQDAFLFERHRISPVELASMRGVDGYNTQAIDAVLTAHPYGGLKEWLLIDDQRARIESQSDINPLYQSDLIDALQYWGSALGRDLIEWGMPRDAIEDPFQVYEIEAWLIGDQVIKAVINTDPLARRPYYGDSFERVPGAFWGTSLHSTMADCEDMCNAAARALANNMGIASGPQVWMLADRLADGEEVTSMYPWKLWQMTADPSGSTALPMGFFQPTSNAAELMAVFDKYSQLADEVTGIPRYMTGDGPAGGAGRTASGMSMMVGNAGKTIKKSVRSIDLNVLEPTVEGLYEHIMLYEVDEDMKGDLNIMARGAMTLMTKDAAQLRRNEFLQITSNPIDMQIIGMEGRANLLREAAKTLDMNSDKVVPSESVLKLRLKMTEVAQMQAAQQAQAAQKADPTKPGGKQLMDGSPVTDNFGPQGR